jgi:hypothetical protein
VKQATPLHERRRQIELTDIIPAHAARRFMENGRGEFAHLFPDEKDAPR